MLSKVISGGQTGADIAGLRAARACGIETGGTMPKGWLTEDGPRMTYAAIYGMMECLDPGYPARTRENAENSDVTLWFGNQDSAGFYCTQKAVVNAHKRFVYVDTLIETAAGIASVLEHFQCKILNVAGNRESKNPGMEKFVYEFLIKVFGLVGYKKI